MERAPVVNRQVLWQGDCHRSNSQQKDGREEHVQDLRLLTVYFSDNEPSSRILRHAGDTSGLFFRSPNQLGQADRDTYCTYNVSY